MHIITGGAGFLGSALLWELNNHGIDDVLIVDNLSTSEKWRNLVNCRYIDYIHRDRFLELVRDRKLSGAVESVVHLGACSSTTERDADFLMANNFHYSQAVCRFALEKGARFINASSAATYGAGEHGFCDDPAGLVLLKPLNMYGYSKHLFDLWLYREDLAKDVASLKFFNVYGPNEYHKGKMASVASKLFHEIGQTGKATLFASNRADIADGEQRRDFVYVKDCVALIAWLLFAGKNVNGVRNVGAGIAATFNEVATAVFEALDMKADIGYCPMPEELNAKYQNYTCADMAWLERENCPVRFTHVKDGVRDYVINYLSRPDPYLNNLKSDLISEIKA